MRMREIFPRGALCAVSRNRAGDYLSVEPLGDYLAGSSEVHADSAHLFREIYTGQRGPDTHLP